MTGSLRSAWYEAQRRDGSLAGILRKTEHPFVLGGDGLLEREVQLTAGRVVRVAVVPNGVAGATGDCTAFGESCLVVYSARRRQEVDRDLLVVFEGQRTSDKSGK